MEMMNGYTEPTFRVYNECKFDIGVTTTRGTQYNIRPGSFAMLTAADIEYIESICQTTKFFGTGMLVPKDAAGNAIPLDKLNIVEAPKEERMMTDEEIMAMLKKTGKQMEAWLDGIEDPVKLHAIYDVAVKMDLPASKLKILNGKMPNKDWLDAFN